jgi:putative DNA primase/helicase
MNDLPRIVDPNNGIFRRAKIIHLPQIEKKDPTMKIRIGGEGAGILNWALDGLDRLRNRGAFEVPESIREAIEDFKSDADVECAFLNEKYNLTKNPDDKVKPNDLYSIYRDWCIENGHKPKSSTRVARDWRRLGLTRVTMHGYPMWAGISSKYQPILLQNL